MGYSLPLKRGDGRRQVRRGSPARGFSGTTTRSGSSRATRRWACACRSTRSPGSPTTISPGSAAGHGAETAGAAEGVPLSTLSCRPAGGPARPPARDGRPGAGQPSARTGGPHQERHWRSRGGGSPRRRRRPIPRVPPRLGRAPPGSSAQRSASSRARPAARVHAADCRGGLPRPDRRHRDRRGRDGHAAHHRGLPAADGPAAQQVSRSPPIPG